MCEQHKINSNRNNILYTFGKKLHQEKQKQRKKKIFENICTFNLDIHQCYKAIHFHFNLFTTNNQHISLTVCVCVFVFNKTNVFTLLTEL